MRRPLATARRACTAFLTLSLVLAVLAPAAAVGQEGGAGVGRRSQPGRDARGRRGAAGARPEARRTSAAAGATQARPRLVLLIVIDQFRYDYLERFGDLFAPNGFRRLLRDGASWAEANYDHIPTETAPGHATLLTGAWPAETGIIGNEWFERDTGKRVSNVTDETAKLLGGGPSEVASSPRRLLASTLGDELRLVTDGRSKVVGISVKDRAAILPAGRHASAAYWYSSQTGQMVSSTYYFNRVPDWVERFNAAKPADKFFGAKWERLLPEAEYARRAGRDDAAWENQDAPTRDTKTFPHTITGGASALGAQFYGALNYSPYSNDLLVSFAEQAVAGEGLGADSDTDVLSVSFSANDYVGHRFGPYSQEAMDISLRVDRQIGELLDFVDARVGLAHTLVAFTADHGVAPVPEHAATLGLPGGRVKATDILNAVRNAVRVRYGKPGEAEDKTNEYVLAFANENVYFNTSALRRDRIDADEIARVAGEAALTVPGITRFFTRAQLERGAISPSDPVARRALHGFNSKRSGDVVVIQEPFKYIGDGVITATHGAPYSYDTHVPVVIMGGGVKPGRYFNAVTPADIAPTLAALLGVQAPSSAVGRVLIEALK